MKEKSRILEKLLHDQTRPVLFKESFGGSESQLRLLLKYLPDESFKDINLILNNSDHKLLEKNKINILWMQHFVNQKEAQNLASKEYLDKLDYIVFNSHWNFEKFFYQFKVPEHKSLVIKNAIEKITFEKKPKDKINLIYHTTPWRGLEILINVFEKLDAGNVELNVCSSTIIYGKKFNENIGNKYENLFEKCKKTKNVNYLGFVENKKVIELLKKSHIYAYPSIWPETSCISAIESMGAGCEIVTTNLGALYETCAPFGILVNFDHNLKILENKYLKTLEKSIKNFWSKENQEKLNLQQQIVNKHYSWDARSAEWKNFFDEARSSKI